MTIKRKKNIFGFCLWADLPSLHLITQFDSFIKSNRRQHQRAPWSKTDQWLKLPYCERPDPKHFHLVSCWNLYDFSLPFFFSCSPLLTCSALFILKNVFLESILLLWRRKCQNCIFLLVKDKIPWYYFSNAMRGLYLISITFEFI